MSSRDFAEAYPDEPIVQEPTLEVVERLHKLSGTISLADDLRMNSQT
jgi:hypothetical protein